MKGEASRDRKRSGDLFVRTGDLFEPALDGRELSVLAQDEENGVIAGEGTENLGPFLPIEGLCHGLGAAGKGFDDEQVAGAFGADEKSREEALERWRAVPAFGGRGVVVAALRIRDLDEAEFADVARESGLGHIEAAPAEQFTEVFLAGDAIGLNEFTNGCMPCRFGHERALGTA
jgi:hypothetical protein